MESETTEDDFVSFGLTRCCHLPSLGRKEEQRVWGRSKFSFKHIKLKISMSSPSGDIKSSDCYLNLVGTKDLN